MEIAAKVWSWVGPKAMGTARFGGEPRRHGACVKGSYLPTSPEPAGRQTAPCAHSARGPEGRRSAAIFARSGASEVGTATRIRSVYPVRGPSEA